MSATPGMPSAASRVYDHLKRGILDGSRPGGELVTEGELADETGVSRTPVREALLRLEGEGLVRLFPKRGALVVPVSAEVARQVLEARAVIEEWAAAAMWPRRASLVPRLEERLAAMRVARGAQDIAGFAENDRLFHEVIVSAAGNPILTRTYQGLRDRQLCILTSQMRMSAARMDAALRGHAELLAALRTGTRAAFLQSTGRHLDSAWAALQGQR